MNRILIIEDDENMQKLYGDIFDGSKRRYGIDIVGDASLAHAKIKDRKYDLIILDLIMEPVMGDVFYADLKKENETKDIPVLFISVLRPDFLEHVGKTTKDDYLQKPVTGAALIEKIDRMMR